MSLVATTSSSPGPRIATQQQTDRAAALFANLFLPGLGSWWAARRVQAVLQGLLFLLGQFLVGTIFFMVPGLFLCGLAWLWGMLTLTLSRPGNASRFQAPDTRPRSTAHRAAAALQWLLVIPLGPIPGVLFGALASRGSFLHQQAVLAIHWCVTAALLMGGSVLVMALDTALLMPLLLMAGAVLMVDVLLLHLICTVLAAVAAGSGAVFKMPFLLRLPRGSHHPFRYGPGQNDL